MEKHRLLILSFLLGVLILVGMFSLVRVGASPLFAGGGAPTVVSYQGVVKDGGVPYTGTGYFKFAVVDAAGDTTYWSNDGTSSGGLEPAEGVQLVVAEGLFHVMLGDTNLTNMVELSAGVFEGTERYLRVWFSSDGSAYTQLTPDRRIAAVPYALQAQEAASAGALQDYPVADTAPSAGEVLKWDGASWAPGEDQGEEYFWGLLSLDDGYFKTSEVHSGTVTIPAEGNSSCGLDEYACVHNFGNGEYLIQFRTDQFNFPFNITEISETVNCWAVSSGDNDLSYQGFGNGAISVVTDSNGDCLTSAGLTQNCAGVFVRTDIISHTIYGVVCRKLD